jgi:2-dehydro-3-deoxy-D-arabinonate dehydratase
MHLVRFSALGQPPTTGVLVDDVVHPLGMGFSELLSLHLVEIRELVEKAKDGLKVRVGDVKLLAPADGQTEIWAAGVTYQRSRDARVAESKSGDIYLRVYQSSRPELFFKSLAWKVVTDGEPVGIRTDSKLNVPEPELAVVVNAFGEIVGYTICNDVSSRDIEGENPLYLPQAKAYAGSCALGNLVRPSWEMTGAANLTIVVELRRQEQVIWSASTSTRFMIRTPIELTRQLLEFDQFPKGVILSTGTGVVPEMDVTMEEGDLVAIEIDEIGKLTNKVVSGKERFEFLVERLKGSLQSVGTQVVFTK